MMSSIWNKPPVLCPSNGCHLKPSKIKFITPWLMCELLLFNPFCTFFKIITFCMRDDHFIKKPAYLFKSSRFSTRGVLTLPTDGGVPLRSENRLYVGLIFWKFLPKFTKKMTLNGTKISKFSLNFLLFSQNCRKKVPDCSILVFLRPYVGLMEVKKDQRLIPVPILPKYPRVFQR